LLSDEIRAAVSTWPSVDCWTVGVQLIRSADSVVANIAEATGRSTLKDQLRLLMVARGSVLEAQQWLMRAKARELQLPVDAQTRADEIGRMLNGLIRSTSRRAKLRAKS
jgi:four helix bundle protein